MEWSDRRRSCGLVFVAISFLLRIQSLYPSPFTFDYNLHPFRLKLHRSIPHPSGLGGTILTLAFFAWGQVAALAIFQID